MLMEAMRLSLLDHEEHQRKEAEEKRKQEATAATATAMQSDGPGPGPSTVESRQSHLDTSSSSNLSSASSMSRSASPSFPNHTKVGSQDSLTPSKKSWSFSRSRTPPLLPPNSVTNVPLSGDNSATCRNRSADPAAIGSATAPSNGGGRWVSRSMTPEPGNRNPASAQSCGTRRASLDNSVPIITLNNDIASVLASRVSDENNNTSPPAPFSKSSNVNNPFNQQAPSTSEATLSTSTSATDELGSGISSHAQLTLSLSDLPSLDFEANDISSKGRP